jgi:hypothetical protein
MSLFIRIKRICTNYSDFLAASYKTTIQLLKRKFCMDNIVSAFNVVRKINREELLPYKFKNDFNSHKTILFFNEFNYNLNINNIISSFRNIIWSFFLFLCFFLITSACIYTNLMSTLSIYKMILNSIYTFLAYRIEPN